LELADRQVNSVSGASSEPAARARPGTARRLRSDDLDALVAGYEAGKTMKELAGEFGVSRQTVGGHLRRAKVPVRRAGLVSGQLAEVVALYESGWTSRELAERFDVSSDTVLRTLRRQGVEVRSRHAAAPRRRT
jgi:DNA-directed RNA polymerase specialized sigma24 family protein